MVIHRLGKYCETGDSHLVSQKVVDDLKKGEPVSKTQELQQLSDDLTMADTVLKKLGMISEVDNQQTILEVLLRCPIFVRNKWRNKALDVKREQGSYPHFSDFVTFIRQDARSLQILVTQYMGVKFIANLVKPIILVVPIIIV